MHTQTALWNARMRSHLVSMVHDIVEETLNRMLNEEG